ncbi:DUF2834 domain-containing protein [Magnetovibrio sp.]|uniref:DUF2834 domain-containing protein n=1 Tax=Magnetovibrio sp. TaxID=2024836 RepID=UPI002F94E041
MRVWLLVLFGVGVIVPYAAFAPWFLDHGANALLFVHEMFANRIAAFFALDVIVAAIALISAAVFAHRHGGRGLGAVVAATLLIGVSAGLPLYLYYRWRETPSR